MVGVLVCAWDSGNYEEQFPFLLPIKNTDWCDCWEHISIYVHSKPDAKSVGL